MVPTSSAHPEILSEQLDPLDLFSARVASVEPDKSNVEDLDFYALLGKRGLKAF